MYNFLLYISLHFHSNYFFTLQIVLCGKWKIYNSISHLLSFTFLFVFSLLTMSQKCTFSCKNPAMIFLFSSIYNGEAEMKSYLCVKMKYWISLNYRTLCAVSFPKIPLTELEAKKKSIFGNGGIFMFIWNENSRRWYGKYQKWQKNIETFISWRNFQLCTSISIGAGLRGKSLSTGVENSFASVRGFERKIDETFQTFANISTLSNAKLSSLTPQCRMEHPEWTMCCKDKYGLSQNEMITWW